MRQLSFSGLRFRLLMLVLLAVLPAFGVTLYTGWSQRRLAAEDAQADALRLTRLSATNLARSVEAARQLLAALAGLREVHALDPAACSALMASLLKQFPGYVNLGAVKPDGYFFCSALPLKQPTSAADQTWFQRAVETGAFALGDYQIGRISDQAILVGGYPVLDRSGKVRAIVSAGLELGWLNRLAAEAQLPEGAALVVIDRQGTILARHPDSEKWVGRFLPEAPLIEAILARGEGTVEVSGVDGSTRLFAFMPVQGTGNGIYVSIGVSKEAAFAAANALFARSLVVLVLGGALTLGAAWVLSDLVILRRVNALARAAERLTGGDLGARADMRGDDEIGMMARAFNAMAEGLAGMIMAEEHARKALAQHAREADLLNRMGELLQACPTPEDAYTVLRSSMEQFFPDQSGAVLVVGPSRNLMEAKVEWGASGVGEKGAFAPEACWALRRGQAHIVEDTGSGLLCQHLPMPLPSAYLCIPLLAQGDALGILHVNSPPGRVGPGADLPEGKPRLAVTLAEQIALALANLRLRETLLSQSIRDPLTGLFNRRYMLETLERELHWAQRRRRPVGVIVLDIDRFKPFNDTHGHDAGDAVLRELGGLLDTNSRGGDIACRFGGEEFVLILPEADLEDTRRRAEQLREAAKGLRVSHRGKILKPFTLSMGVAAFPKHGESGEALLKAADAACYRAKREGRNRVAVGE